MKNLYKISSLIVSLLLTVSVFCSCAGKAANDNAKTYNDFDGGAVEEYETQAANSGASFKSSDISKKATKDRKIIEYVNFSVETKTFDKLIDEINACVEKAEGYIENSQIGGNSYYGNENRTAELTVRIPKEKQSDFSSFLSKNCNVINKSVNAEDVTDSYIDTQSRIKALTLEKETLEKLITQSTNLSDTLTVYEKLTNVIAELESYQGKLNGMDNRIEYTTVTVHIVEVEKETKVQKQNWFAKTWNGLVDNLCNVGNGILDFISFVISSLPYLIILGAVAVITVIIIRRRKKKSKAKNENINF